MRKSANYFRIFVAVIAFIWSFKFDILQPAAGKKHIEAKIYLGKAEKNEYYW